MDINKFTQKSQEAINDSQAMAIKNSNPEVNEIHLAYALVNNSDSIVSQIIKSMDVDYEGYRNELIKKVDSMPSQSGNSNTYPSQVFQRILLKAEDVAKEMGDSFVSTEHIFLSLLKEKTEVDSINKKFGISAVSFKNSIQNFRKGQKVTNDNPEETTNPLEKFGRNLTQEAREGKIDPVIGRDREIRNALRILSRRKKITQY